MVNWQRILWDLRYKNRPVADVSRIIGYNSKSLQMIANGRRKNDLPYTAGVKLLKLHGELCQ